MMFSILPWKSGLYGSIRLPPIQAAVGEVSPGSKDIPAWNFIAICLLMFLASAGASAVDHCQEWDARLGKLKFL